jgi:cyclic beta-1,2-glucan synthetase
MFERPRRDGRLVIGLFSGAKPFSSTTAEKLIGQIGSGRVFTSDGKGAENGAGGSSKAGSSSKIEATAYTKLILAGETMLAIRVEGRAGRSAIDVLHSEGASAIFLVPEETPTPLAPRASFGAVRPDGPGLEDLDVRRELSESWKSIQNSIHYLRESVRLGHSASPAAQWLLDNKHVIRTEILEIQRDLPPAFRKRLGQSGAQLLRMARRLIQQASYYLSANLVEDFLREEQQNHPLTIGQLWAFPLFLQIVLIEELREVANRTSGVQQLREAAYLWADRLIASARKEDDALERMVALLNAEPLAADSTFATTLMEQLLDQETPLGAVQPRLEEHVGAPMAEMVRAQHSGEALDATAAANAFGSLRELRRIQFAEIFEAVSLTEAELRKDPSGVYSKSDFETRDRCRQRVETAARSSTLPEPEVARAAVGLAEESEDPAQRIVLRYLIGDRIPDLEQRVGARPRLGERLSRVFRAHGIATYLGSILGLTVTLIAVTVLVTEESHVHQHLLVGLLMTLALFPLSELSIQIVQALLVSLLPPGILPKLHLAGGIPDESATLVAVPMMLGSAGAIRRELEKLETRYLGNPEANLSFALLSDFLDAPQQTAPKDAGLLEIARKGIAELNARSPGQPFLFFHRPRTWSESEQKWIGKERKRGKVEALNAFLAGEYHENFSLVEGKLASRIRYVIVLDADTQLPPGSALRMVETISHPLNRVELDPQTHIRRSGFSIIQPRVSIALPGATATRFTRVFSDAYGTDPYCLAVSDAQFDLFGEAIFHGKAIYDVEAFHSAAGHRFPPETILSHDLIEGAHAGTGLASDIEVLENLPVTYPTYANRQHRWIRGDWQIASWVFPHVPGPDRGRVSNDLCALNRWRVLDNLRRSLVPIASLLLLILGWFFSVTPGVWSLVLALAVVVPTLAPILDRWSRHVDRTVYGWQGATDDLLRSLVMLAFLPHQAWIAGDAIARALYRRYFSKRNLLEWRTAEEAERRSHVDPIIRQMFSISILSVLALIYLSSRGAFAPTFGFLALWIASPGIMAWLSRPGFAAAGRPLQRSDVQKLKLLARRTWRYFDDLVGPASNWLPPDNSQLALNVEVAQRTSPTNIGLWLASALAAHDFGYLSTDEFLKRTGSTLDTIDKLERYEGHLLNWYDTRTLQPLLPRYVSTVDSGNLIACLWVVAQGARDMISAPLLDVCCFDALSSTLEALREASGSDVSAKAAIHGLGPLLATDTGHLERIGQLRLARYIVTQLAAAPEWGAPGSSEMSYWASKLAGEVTQWNSTADRYLHWKETLSRPPDALVQMLGEDAVQSRRQALEASISLDLLAAGGPGELQRLIQEDVSPELDPQARDWVVALRGEHKKARGEAHQTVQALRALAARANGIAHSMSMRFLYDPSRRLFGIGYAIGEPLVFNSHYDLLASECRLASLVAIAKHDVPVQHWFALARPRVSTPQRKALLSWSGTMFEYLTPLLFTEAFRNSLLEGSCREAVEAHVAYGNRHAIPWGISESAYGALDGNKIYQYKAFGVPELALNSSQEAGPVVAPYATVLALMVDPREAVSNIERLEGLGLSGIYGLYESIDFTRQREKSGKPGVVIFAYMAHHQGMSLVALSNALIKNVMQRRFHADIRIRAVEPLLFERAPIARLEVEAQQETHAPARLILGESQENPLKETTVIPQVHLNSNGRYSLMITNSGGGYSRWKDFDITRWRADTTLDPWGTFFLCRDLRSDTFMSATHQPLDQGEGSVVFAADHAEFKRRLNDIEMELKITVSTEDDAEIRRLTMINRSMRTRSVELTSYLELAMAPHGADVAHPAFAKMFVETSALDDKALIAYRRPRSPEEQPIWTACILLCEAGEAEYETDRRKFLGRTSDVTTAEALRTPLSRTVGTVIDPIFSFRCRGLLEPRERTEVSMVLMAAASREEIVAMIEKYRRHGSVSRAFEMAWTGAQLAFRYLGIGPSSAHRFQELASHMIYPNSRLRMIPARQERSRLRQSALWGYGISGDLPILIVTVADSRGLPLLKEVLTAHSYWRMRGFQADLIVLNREAPSYELPLRKTMARSIQGFAGEGGIDHPGGVYLRDWNSIPEDHREFLLASARVVLQGHRGTLQNQLLGPGDTPLVPPPSPERVGEPRAEPELPAIDRTHFNGFGGFTGDGREYVIDVKRGAPTPAPWANVMANPRFGTVVSESGLGFTWYGNSQANRLTPWHNDPVSDPQSEAIYLRDADSGATWSPTPLPLRSGYPFRIRHGQGYSIFESSSRSLNLELTVFVPREDPVKVCRLRIRNSGARTRALRVIHFAEWLLGSSREQQQMHVATSFDVPTGILTAREGWLDSFPSQIAFASASPKAGSYSGNRTTFLGRNGSKAIPAALGEPELDNMYGPALDPCAALKVQVRVSPGATEEVTFLLGAAESMDAVQRLASRYGSKQEVEKALREVQNWWDRSLSVVQVQTPAISIDFALNRWLLYQALSCRFWARSATYQSGGAFGFRDQLQDCVAYLHFAPEIAREHILTASSRQFPEGDVQHWWHAETGLGVRTTCSDDLLWLPWAVARYVETTSDLGILKERTPFVTGPMLDPGQHEKMFRPTASAATATLWEHCLLAIKQGTKLGEHGLPLFGNGDWNDGMNQVGVEGRGESVWLGWFLIDVLQAFVTLSDRQGDRSRIAEWREQITSLKSALEMHAWDGEWYLRGFFDNGAPLGSQHSEEAKIDSLPQSWSVIAQGSNSERQYQAVASALEKLVRPQDSLVCLFTPPFDHSEPHPGYIMGYPPGLRENGGQYTHGALWLAMACARLGNGGRAVSLLQMMNPIERTSTRQRVLKYRGEPYVVAADVSAAPGLTGTAGWTWYTGSAGWMYRVWVEEVLGLRVEGKRLYLRPVIPHDWPGFTIVYRYRSTTYELTVGREAAHEPQPDFIELLDDGQTHKMYFQIGASAPEPALSGVKSES